MRCMTRSRTPAAPTRLHSPVLAIVLLAAACHVDATTPEATTPTGPNSPQPPDPATNLNYPEPGDYITVGRGGLSLWPCQPEDLAEGSCRSSEADTIRVHPGDTIRVGVSGSGTGSLEACTVVVSGPQDACANEMATGERAIFQASWLDDGTIRCRYEAQYAQLVRAGGGTYEPRGSGGVGDCIRLQILGVLPIGTTSTPWGVGGNGFPMTFVQHKTYVARECADSYLYGEVSEGTLQRLSSLVPRPDTVWVFITGCPGDATGPNRAPVVAKPMPDRMWAAGPERGRVVFDAAAHFRDPDGNRLAYTVASSDTAVAAASFGARANGGVVVSLEMRAVGAASVTVNVRDPGGLEARAAFAATVTRGPRAERCSPRLRSYRRSDLDAERQLADGRAALGVARCGSVAPRWRTFRIRLRPRPRRHRHERLRQRTQRPDPLRTG